LRETIKRGGQKEGRRGLLLRCGPFQSRKRKEKKGGWNRGTHKKQPPPKRGEKDITDLQACSKKKEEKNLPYGEFWPGGKKESILSSIQNQCLFYLEGCKQLAEDLASAAASRGGGEKKEFSDATVNTTASQQKREERGTRLLPPSEGRMGRSEILGGKKNARSFAGRKRRKKGDCFGSGWPSFKFGSSARIEPRKRKKKDNFGQDTCIPRKGREERKDENATMNLNPK